MFDKIFIEPMNNEHINDSIILWKKQFKYFCSDTDMFSYWENNTQDIEAFIRTHAENGNGIIAKIDNKLLVILHMIFLIFTERIARLYHFPAMPLF
jgi:hypothetical protein